MKTFARWCGILLALLLLQTLMTFGHAAGAAETGALAERLRQLSEDQQALRRMTRPGTPFKQRLYASGRDSAEVRQLVQRMGATAIELQAALLSDLAQERLAQAGTAGDPAELRARRALIDSYSATVSEISSYGILYDDGLVARMSRSHRILPEGVAPIRLTAFDYTRGFAAQCEQAWASGLIAYRNPRTGAIRFVSQWKSGVAVVGARADGEPVTKTEWKSGLSSALDPRRGTYDLGQGGWKTPIASVYDPRQGVVVHRKSDWRTGIAGVYNPSTGQVEWKKEWSSGVAGYFDPNQNRVVWKSAWKSGVACIWRASDGQFETSAGFFGGEVDDDD